MAKGIVGGALGKAGIPYSTATQSAAGLMTPAHIAELNGKLSIFKNVTLYVATDGNDTTGDGTEAHPFASIQRALDVIDGYYVNCDIRIKHGEYHISSSIRLTKGNRIYIRGHDTTYTNLPTLVVDGVQYGFELFGANAEFARMNITFNSTRQDQSSLFFVNSGGDMKISRCDVTMLRGGDCFIVDASSLYLDNCTVGFLKLDNLVGRGLCLWGPSTAHCYNVQAKTSTDDPKYKQCLEGYHLGGGVITSVNTNWNAVTEVYKTTQNAYI